MTRTALENHRVTLPAENRSLVQRKKTKCRETWKRRRILRRLSTPPVSDPRSSTYWCDPNGSTEERDTEAKQEYQEAKMLNEHVGAVLEPFLDGAV